MDYAYWHLNEKILEEEEKLKQTLLNHYDLGFDSDDESESNAYNEVELIVKNGCELSELYDIINYEKLRTVILIACRQQNLNYEDFDIYTNGIDVSVTYKGESIT